MSDKQLALESIQRFPDDASREAIAERLGFSQASAKDWIKSSVAKPFRMTRSNGSSQHGSPIDSAGGGLRPGCDALASIFSSTADVCAAVPRMPSQSPSGR
jgi:hypothetical protein